MSFLEITDGRAELASVVLDGNGNSVDVTEVIGFYADATYRRYAGGKGSTARRSWSFLDDNENVLFTLTDLGNRSLIQISMDGKERLYQAF